ncbi:hypothetical protein [Parasphingorhabdus pacifica]
MGEQRVHSRRLVLRRDVGEESVQEFAVSRLGWPRRAENPGDPRAGTERQIVWYEDPAITLHFFDEVLTENGFVTVAGEDPEAVAAMAETVQDGLDTWRLDELLHALDDASAPEETATALLRAGVGSPKETHDGFVARITELMRSESVLVREASTWAIACSGLDEFKEPLRWMADNDPEPELAKLAWMTLEALSEH